MHLIIASGEPIILPSYLLSNPLIERPAKVFYRVKFVRLISGSYYRDATDFKTNLKQKFYFELWIYNNSKKTNPKVINEPARMEYETLRIACLEHCHLLQFIISPIYFTEGEVFQNKKEIMKISIRKLYILERGCHDHGDI